MNPSTSDRPVRVAAFYRFVAIAEPRRLCAELAALSRKLGLRGTLLIASEGFNGTVAGAAHALDALLGELQAVAGGPGLAVKFSDAATMPFHRLKVRVRREIVTMGVDGMAPVPGAAGRVDPAAWNALLADPRTVVVDARNAYEVALGSFRNAIDPQTERFRDFPAWLSRRRDALAGRRLALFCTGGIRCEKAAAYAASIGLAEVYQLDGGILRYLAETAERDSLWQGECFVFDERVSVVHGLAPGEASLCRGCRRPLTAGDRASPLYREGVCCAACAAERSAADRAGAAERHRQMALAAARGGRHLGR